MFKLDRIFHFTTINYFLTVFAMCNLALSCSTIILPYLLSWFTWHYLRCQTFRVIVISAKKSFISYVETLYLSPNVSLPLYPFLSLSLPWLIYEIFNFLPLVQFPLHLEVFLQFSNIQFFDNSMDLLRVTSHADTYFHIQYFNKSIGLKYKKEIYLDKNFKYKIT